MFYLQNLWVFFEVFDDLLSLHEVVAVLTVNHEKLVVGLEVFAYFGAMRVPAKNSSFEAPGEVLAVLGH